MDQHGLTWPKQGNSRVPYRIFADPEIYRAEILIMEMTFVARNERPSVIHKYGHTHLDDFLARAERFENEVIIASHFSTRYQTRRIRELVEKAIPDMFGQRLHLWL